MISRNALIVCLSLSAALAGGSALGKDWKTVVVGTEGGYPPYNLTDSAGKIVGFEPDLLADLCARMKVECNGILAQTPETFHLTYPLRWIVCECRAGSGYTPQNGWIFLGWRAAAPRSYRPLGARHLPEMGRREAFRDFHVRPR